MFRRTVALLACAALAVLALLIAPSRGSAAPSGEPAYADGATYWMHSEHVVTGASAGLLTAPPMYVLVFTPPAGTSPGSSITLYSGYAPQCNPCEAEPFAYHDHLLTGEPGSGTNGTAGDYTAPWRIVIMHYSPAYSNSPSFVPVTSDADLATAEAAGDFLPINASGHGDPYQIWTQNVLICPLVRAG